MKLTGCDGKPLELPKSVVAKWDVYHYPLDPGQGGDGPVGEGSAITTVTDRVFCVRESCGEVARQYEACHPVGTKVETLTGPL